MPPKHGINYVKLSRTTAHRMAMFRNQVTSLMKHERILTTLAKAKALRRLADWTITQGKVNTVASHVRANGFVREHPVTKKVFLDLAQRYKFRPGGYCRVVRIRNRIRDNAPMAYIELVDRPDELRPARPVSYPYAIAKKLVPLPKKPLPTDPAELEEVARRAPGTSRSKQRHPVPMQFRAEPRKMPGLFIKELVKKAKKEAREKTEILRKAAEQEAEALEDEVKSLRQQVNHGKQQLKYERRQARKAGTDTPTPSDDHIELLDKLKLLVERAREKKRESQSVEIAPQLSLEDAERARTLYVTRTAKRLTKDQARRMMNEASKDSNIKAKLHRESEKEKEINRVKGIKINGSNGNASPSQATA